MILPPERRRILTDRATTYADNLPDVLPYLLDRGISQQVAEMFMLGYVPPGGEYSRRLTIPYITPAGVVQMKYRCVNPDHHVGTKHTGDCPKYLYDTGTGTRLYNAQVLIQTPDRVVVTEGELDAIAVQAYCGVPAVGYPGAKAWQKHPHYRLCFEGVSEVIVVADGDDTGREAARRVAESIGTAARVLDLPSGEDSNSVIASEGAGAFLQRLDN